jgi:uncharacterized protein (TIGR00725 family)
MTTRIVIGVMGAGEHARQADIVHAERLGELIAREKWVLLTGGRDAGVMAAAVRGAGRVSGSLTVGILPTDSGPTAPGLDIPIFTGLGNARNAINVLSSRVVITCGTLTPGTLSEAALALKVSRPLVLLAPNPEAEAFFSSLGEPVSIVQSPEEAIARVKRILKAGAV